MASQDRAGKRPKRVFSYACWRRLTLEDEYPLRGAFTSVQNRLSCREILAREDSPPRDPIRLPDLRNPSS